MEARGQPSRKRASRAHSKARFSRRRAAARRSSPGARPAQGLRRRPRGSIERRVRRRGPTSLTTPVGTVQQHASWKSWLLFLSPCDLAGEPLELFAIEHGAIDHAEDELLGRAAAEAVDYVFRGADRNVLAPFSGAIDEGAASNFVHHVALLLEAAKHGSNGGLLHGARGCQRLAAVLG